MVQVANSNTSLINSSLDKGAQPTELKEFLVTDQGWSQEDANSQVDSAIQAKLQTSLDQGAPQDELVNFVSEKKGYEPTYLRSLLSTGIQEAITPVEEVPQKPNFLRQLAETELPEDQATEELSVTEQIAALDRDDPLYDQSQAATKPLTERIAQVKNIHAKYATSGKELRGLFGDQKAKVSAARDSLDLAGFIVNNLNENNISARVDDETGDILVEDEGGNFIPVDSSIWEDLVASRMEVISGITAGLTSGAAGAYAGRQIGGPYGAIAGFAIGAAGGAAGALFGRREDILRNALETKEKVDSELMWSQLKDAGAAEAIFAVGGTALLKTSALAVKGVYRAFDLVIHGNKEGAYTALKELTHLDDLQVDEVIKDWENLTGRKAPGHTRATKALEVIPRTAPGGEAAVSPAAQLSPSARSNISEEINVRAQQLLKLADTSDRPDISSVLREELVEYKSQVKQFFGATKDIAINQMKDSDYTFDYKELAIDPILERTSKELTNPVLRERALNYMERIRQIGGEVLLDGATGAGESKLRTFEDLLDLRRVLNEFGSSKLVKNAKDIQLLQDIRGNIDDEIATAVRSNMADPETWLKSWKEANTEYGKMFQLESNVLYKQIIRKGTIDANLARQLMTKASATDNTFREVLEKLPPNIRNMAEDSVMNEYVKKYAIGEEVGTRAVDFPALAKQLEQVPFTSKRAQDLKHVVSLMSNVFKNDVNLARGTGLLQVPKFQSYLTADPIVRLKFQIATSVFNYVQRVIPGSKANTVALVMRTAKVLEKPRNVKAMNQLIASLPKDPALKDSLKAMQLEIAKFGEKSEFPKVPIYRKAPKGKAASATSGQLGKGVYYNAKKTPSTAGLRETKMNILPDRIANADNIAAELGIDTVDAKVIRENPQLQEQLKNKGYLGLILEDKILIFK